MALKIVRFVNLGERPFQNLFGKSGKLQFDVPRVGKGAGEAVFRRLVPPNKHDREPLRLFSKQFLQAKVRGVPFWDCPKRV
jgi:hypothetical protein